AGAVPHHRHPRAQGQARGLTPGNGSLDWAGTCPGLAGSRRPRRGLFAAANGWEDDAVDPFFNFVTHFWWLVFPLSGLAGGWARSWSKAAERRHRRRVELYTL